MSSAHKITARGYLITARPNISAGWVWAFRVPLVAGGAAGTSRSESGDQVTAVVTAQVGGQVTERLEAIYQQKLAALEALKKSLLHQAFSGQL